MFHLLLHLPEELCTKLYNTKGGIMAKKKKVGRAPATNPKAQEDRLISLAYKRAEEMLQEGTAPPSIITHFLKMGSSSQKQDMELKESQAVLAKSKADSIKTSKDSQASAEEAIAAFKNYKVK